MFYHHCINFCCFSFVLSVWVMHRRYLPHSLLPAADAQQLLALHNWVTAVCCASVLLVQWTRIYGKYADWSALRLIARVAWSGAPSSGVITNYWMHLVNHVRNGRVTTRDVLHCNATLIVSNCSAATGHTKCVKRRGRVTPLQKGSSTFYFWCQAICSAVCCR